MTVALVSEAQQVTREEARLRAERFFLQQGKSVRLSDKGQDMRDGMTASGPLEESACHVFNAEDGQGFVVMAADDCLGRQVLAYGEKGEFDMEHLNPGAKAWMESIARLTAYLHEHGLQGNAANKAPRAVVAPIVKTAWAQSAPYNSLVNEGKYLTGCGATAMAQVMSVYRFPQTVQASIPDYITKTLSYPMEGAAAGTPIDWANMVDNYWTSETTSAQRKAVAQLMRYCGAAVKMDYGEKASSSSLEDMAAALKNYFGYYRGIKLAYHGDYNNASWDNLIYQELAEGRPVVIFGSTQNNEGHIFICDGYNADGLYHINWGWGGDQDAFYALTDLTPSLTPLSFNFSQACITGIKPDDGTFTETAVLTTLGLELIDIKSGAATAQTEYTLPVGYRQYFVAYRVTIGSNLAETYDFDVNMAVYQDGKFVEMLYDEDGIFAEPVEISPSMYGAFKLSYLPPRDSIGYKSFHNPGTYVLKVVSRQAGTTEWHVNEGSAKYCLVCVIDNDMKLTCSIGQGNPTPDPDPDVITEVEKANLQALATQLQIEAEAKIKALESEKQVMVELLEKDINKANATMAEVLGKLVKIRARVAEAELDETTKNTLLSYIDNDLIDNYLEHENVWGAVDRVTELCKNTLDKIIEEIESLNGIVAKAGDMAAQVATIADRAAYTELEGEVTALRNEFAVHQAYSSSDDRNTALSLLSTALLNLKTLEDYYIPQLEQRVEDAINGGALQKKKDEVLAQLTDIREKASQVISTFEDVKEEYNRLIELLAEKRKAYIEMVNMAQEAEQQLKLATLTDEQYDELWQRLETISKEISSQAAFLNAATEIMESLNLPTNTTMNELVNRYNELFQSLDVATTVEAVEEVAQHCQALSEAVEAARGQMTAYGEQLKDVVKMMEEMPSCENVPSAIDKLKNDVKEAEQLTRIGVQQWEGKRVVGCYDANGRPTGIRSKGLKILRFSDGSMRKEIIQ